MTHSEMACFTARELELLDHLTEMASEVTNARIADRFRAVGWPQHYGFPTSYVDLTNDVVAVALHFAASTGGDPPPEKRVVCRIDLEAIEEKVYDLVGKETPLQRLKLSTCILHGQFGSGHGSSVPGRMPWNLTCRTQSTFLRTLKNSLWMLITFFILSYSLLKMMPLPHGHLQSRVPLRLFLVEHHHGHWQNGSAPESLCTNEYPLKYSMMDEVVAHSLVLFLQGKTTGRIQRQSLRN